MENQEQQNKIMGVMITLFILTTIVTTVTAIMFFTEKNKLVKQNKIANDIILKYNNGGNKVSSKTNVSTNNNFNAEEQEDSVDSVSVDSKLSQEATSDDTWLDELKAEVKENNEKWNLNSENKE